MSNFFKSLFSSKPQSTENEKQKSTKKNFEIFKYDGLRAQRMGRPDYAIKCFTEALVLEEDFETLAHLSQLYIHTNELDKAQELLKRMGELEPHLTSTFLTMATVCHTQQDYKGMQAAVHKAIAIEQDNAMAHYLLAKASQELDEMISSIGHLTKAIVLNEAFTEARLMRAETLLKLNQPQEAQKDIDAILAQNPEEEAGILLHGKLNEVNGEHEAAQANYQRVTEINPFNEQAYLYLGQLFILQTKLPQAIELFDEAIELNPHFAAAYHQRGRAKLMNGDKDGSIEDMKLSLELNPKEGEHVSGQFDNHSAPSTNVLGL